MADILIKIPDEIVSFVNINGFIPQKYIGDVSKALLESTSLPKGEDYMTDEEDITALKNMKKYKRIEEIVKFYENAGSIPTFVLKGILKDKND